MTNSLNGISFQKQNPTGPNKKPEQHKKSVVVPTIANGVVGAGLGAGAAFLPVNEDKVAFQLTGDKMPHTKSALETIELNKVEATLTQEYNDLDNSFDLLNKTPEELKTIKESTDEAHKADKALLEKFNVDPDKLDDAKKSMRDKAIDVRNQQLHLKHTKLNIKNKEAKNIATILNNDKVSDGMKEEIQTRVKNHLGETEDLNFEDAKKAFKTEYGDALKSEDIDAKFKTQIENAEFKTPKLDKLKELKTNADKVLESKDSFDQFKAKTNLNDADKAVTKLLKNGNNTWPKHEIAKTKALKGLKSKFTEAAASEIALPAKTIEDAANADEIIKHVDEATENSKKTGKALTDKIDALVKQTSADDAKALFKGSWKEATSAAKVSRVGKFALIGAGIIGGFKLITSVLGGGGKKKPAAQPPKYA